MLNFKRVIFCTDLNPNTLYRKCIKFANLNQKSVNERGLMFSKFNKCF